MKNKDERRFKKMEKKYSIGISLAIIALLGIGLVSAFQFGNGSGFGLGLTDEQKEEMQAHRDSVREAVENNDYSAWQALMQERFSLMQQNINEDTFARLQEKHAEREEFRLAMQEARESGDFEKMQELKEQYGVGNKGNGMKGQRGMMNGQGPESGNCPFVQSAE